MHPYLAKRIIKSGILTALSPLARTGVFRHGTGDGVILCYHRILPNNECHGDSPNDWLTVPISYFEQHMEVLATEFEPIAIGDVPSRIGHGRRKHARPFVCVTFDDGYLDNLIHALPVMESHRIPMTVYVTSWQEYNTPRAWWHDLWALLEHSDTYCLQLNSVLLEGSIANSRQKLRAFERISNVLRVGTKEVIADFYEQMPDATAWHVGQERLFMNADELGLLAQHPLVTVGSHTDGHFSLSALNDWEAATQINKSKSCLENLLGKPVSHFAYPYGLPWTFGTRELHLLADAGYSTAVTTSPNRISKETSIFALPRTLVSSHIDGFRLRTMLSGLSGLMGRAL